MPHFPKPFFRTPRGLWYVQGDGRQVNLGPDRDEAFCRYHDLMARGCDQPKVPAGDLVVAILDAFLDWCRDDLQFFARSIPRALVVERLRPIHVQQWVDA